MEINKNANISDTQWFLYPNGYDSNINLLITDASKRILAATILVCDKGSTIPAIQYAEARGYNIHRAEPNSSAGELLEPGDAQGPAATIVETGDGGLPLTRAGIILGRILEYVCYATNHPYLAILIDDLPSLGQVPHIENVLAMSSKINVRFCMTAEHMSEVAAAYPATHIKIIENCKVFF